MENIDIKDKNIKGFNLKKFLFICCFIILFIVLFGVYSRYKATTDLRVVEYKVTDSSLPDDFHGIKVVQLSDIYFGNTVDIGFLERIVSSVNMLKPDIVVFTGDLIVKEIDSDTKKTVIDILSGIESSIGRFAIKGDSDIDLFDEIIVSSGFTLLNNSYANVYYKGDTPIVISNQDIDSSLYNILLIHKPDDVDLLSNSFNLILAGHSLNGQINIPIVKKIFLPDGAKKYYNGYYNINGNSLYVSNGIGTTSFKYRLNNCPTISLYRLTKY